VDEDSSRAADDQRREDRRFYTADGVFITDGMRVWDYDRDPCMVWFTDGSPGGKHWDGWFRCIGDSGAVYLQNGERLCVRDPFTGKQPPQPSPDPRRAALAALETAGVPLRVITDPQSSVPTEPDELVVFDPRVPGDPKPWRDQFHRRYWTAQIEKSPTTT
jgi:hypothetical protein